MWWMPCWQRLWLLWRAAKGCRHCCCLCAESGDCNAVKFHRNDKVCQLLRLSDRLETVDSKVVTLLLGKSRQHENKWQNVTIDHFLYSNSSSHCNHCRTDTGENSFKQCHRIFKLHHTFCFYFSALQSVQWMEKF